MTIPAEHSTTVFPQAAGKVTVGKRKRKRQRRLVWKITGGLFAVILPFFVVLSFMFNEKNKDIELTVREIAGAELLLVSRQLIENMGQYRGLTHIGSKGVRVEKRRLENLRLEIQKDFGAWLWTHGEKSFSPQLVSKLEKIRADWTQLDAPSSSLSFAARFAARSKLVDALLALDLQIANESSLITDPVLSSYYLMEMTLKTLPKFAEYLGIWRGLMSVPVKPQMMDRHISLDPTNGELAIHELWEIKNLFKKLVFGYELILKERPDLAVGLTSSYVTLQEQFYSFDILNKTVYPEDDETTRIFDLNSRIIDSTFALYSAANKALIQDLNGRIARIKAELWQMVAVALVALFFTIIVGWRLGVAFMHPLEAEIKRRKRSEISLRSSEEELIEHRDHLAELVEQRTSELKQQAQQLAEALDGERRLNELQQEFVAMASHEFRTPLAIIDGAAQRIARRADRMPPEELAERTKKIRSAVRRMADLIDRTLDASRLNAGRIQLTPDDLDLKAVLTSVCEHQREISIGNIIDVDVERLPDLILADGKLVEQIFTNLLSNATKYSGDDPRTRVDGWTDGDDAVIRVSDNGVGIPADELPRMFERYFRARTSIGVPGTGIGLNLVKQLVELHTGSIAVVSNEGEGTAFTVRIPIRAEFDEQPAADKADIADADDYAVPVVAA